GSRCRAPAPTAPGWRPGAAAPRCAAVRPPCRSCRRPGLDRVEQLAGDVEPELRIQLAYAGGAGHIDLGEEVADHVQADKAHAPTAHLRPDLGGDPAVTLADRAALAAATGGQVAAELVTL